MKFDLKTVQNDIIGEALLNNSELCIKINADFRIKYTHAIERVIDMAGQNGDYEIKRTDEEDGIVVNVQEKSYFNMLRQDLFIFLGLLFT